MYPFLYFLVVIKRYFILFDEFMILLFSFFFFSREEEGENEALVHVCMYFTFTFTNHL